MDAQPSAQGHGYGDQIQPMPMVSLAPEGPRIEYRYGAADSELAPAMTEWSCQRPAWVGAGIHANNTSSRRGKF
jgi:hypothetical protein